MKINSVFFLGLALSVLLSAFTTFGQLKEFTGPSGGNWHDPGNWDPPGVPGYSDNVFIGGGSNVNVGGMGIGVKGFHNEGQIDNVGNMQVLNDLKNNGILNDAGNIQAGELHNWEDGEINDVKNIVANRGMLNNGIIQGQDGANLNIEVNCSELDSAFAINHEDGQILAQGDNAQVNIIVKVVNFINKGEIKAPKAVWIGAKGGVDNQGLIETQLNETPNPSGDNLNITCINEHGTAVLKNSGSIIASDSSSSGDGADNIHINADNLENSGTIQTGSNGSGMGVYGGYAFIKAMILRNYLGGHILSGSGSCPFIYGHSVTFNNETAGSFRNRLLDGEPVLNGEYLCIVGTNVVFADLPANSIIGEYLIEISTTSLPGFVADFSGLSATPVFHCLYGDIEIKGENIIAPAIGMNAICDPDPVMLSGSAGHLYATLFAPFKMTNQGVSDSVRYLIRNEHTYARSFNYTVTSALGWITPISATTCILDPWESEAVWVHFTIPDPLAETTVDTVRFSAVIASWSVTEITTIIAFPFDTLPTPVSVEEKKPILPEVFTISANPNPFNSSVRITLDGLGAHCNTPLQIEIFDVNGRIVERIPSALLYKGGTEQREAGVSYIWTPDESLPSGVYLVKARIGLSKGSGAETTATKRVVYLK
jgi:hypothetical protein